MKVLNFLIILIFLLSFSSPLEAKWKIISKGEGYRVLSKTTVRAPSKILKCSNCGAILARVSVNCPTCGARFTNYASVGITGGGGPTTRTKVEITTKNQNLLEKIARTNLDMFVQEAAVKAITDMKRIEDIVLTCKNSYIRGTALLRVKDKVLIEKIARGDPDHFNRSLALKLMYDQPLALEIALEDPNEYVLEKTIKDVLTDPGLLSRLVFSDLPGKIRTLATGKIKSRPHLERIAREIKTGKVLLKAAANITDSEVLVFLVKRLTGMGHQQSALAVVYDIKLLKALALAETLTLEVRETAISRIYEGPVRAEIFQVIPAETLLRFRRFDYRKEGLKKLKDAAAIEKIARGDRDKFLRVFALSLLKNQALMIEIAQKDPDKFVLRETVKKFITDPGILSRLAFSDVPGDVRLNAVDKITGQSYLNRIATRAKDKSIRKRAIAKLNDPALLIPLAKNDPDRDIREAAISAVPDQKVLKDLALDDSLDKDMRKFAIGKTTSQSMLMEIFQTLPDANLRRAALENITEPTILAGIVRADKEFYFRETALRKIKDAVALKNLQRKLEKAARSSNKKKPGAFLMEKALLMEMVCEHITGYNKKKAANKRFQSIFSEITEKNMTPELQRILFDIARHASYYSTRGLAVEKITDQEFLGEIAGTESSSSIRKAAVKKISEQSILAKIVKNERNRDIRKLALKKITDRQILNKLSMHDREGDLSDILVDRQKDQTLLAKIAVGAKNIKIRKRAIQKLTDENVLKGLVENDNNPVIRAAA